MDFYVINYRIYLKKYNNRKEAAADRLKREMDYIGISLNNIIPSVRFSDIFDVFLIQYFYSKVIINKYRESRIMMNNVSTPHQRKKVKILGMGNIYNESQRSVQ
jgi:hypothetical protein